MRSRRALRYSSAGLFGAVGDEVCRTTLKHKGYSRVDKVSTVVLLMHHNKRVQVDYTQGTMIDGSEASIADRSARPM